jgi:hypothetical protein
VRLKKTGRKELVVLTRKEAVRILKLRESELGFFEKDAKINASPKQRGYTMREFLGLSRRVRAFYRDPKPRRTAAHCAR